jgi:hypothetical protein
MRSQTSYETASNVKGASTDPRRLTIMNIHCQRSRSSGGQVPHPRPTSTERVIRITAVSLIIFLGIGYALLTFPTNKQDTSKLVDFSEFYAAGQMVRQGLGHSLYDLMVQAEFQLQVAPAHAFYLRPPFEALLFVPFTWLSYRGAYAAGPCLVLQCWRARPD